MSIDFLKTTVTAGALATAVLFAPIAANAAMHSINQSEIAHLEEVDDSGYSEFYQHPDIASFPFRNVYIAPVANEMPTGDIYAARWRPHMIDELAEIYYRDLVEAMEPTGLLVDEPGENTLVIDTRLMFVNKYDERSTGTNIERVGPEYRLRGHAVMEMVWRAGVDGEIVTALRDGRGHQNHSPVTDRDDQFTDAKDVFVLWANDLAAYFGHQTESAANSGS